ncbi:hypothetical protein [Rhodoferax bucti]|uniref:hypothetical protein n=1 Tax=Rhodoferax bucti TaxID=2576305 RepID=UPI0011088C14|nr:hypothetical protein [Rhodoferax bucti]
MTMRSNLCALGRGGLGGIAVVALLGALTACSPGLNWRQVPIAGMTAMLPCKPDTAERTVSLGGQALPMQMAGCEAEGSLFAVSHMEAPRAADVPALQREWQQQALASMRASTFTLSTQGVPAWAQQAMGVQTVGSGPDGKPLRAHLRWLVRGAHIYHLAVYGSAIPDTLTEPMTLEP